MRTGMLALVAGLLVLRFLPALPDTGWLLPLAAVGLRLCSGAFLAFFLVHAVQDKAHEPPRLHLRIELPQYGLLCANAHLHK